ncbi:MAG: hypothetical protein IKE22_08500 [Atopobiaceae bacterium]|nr:hypothetical protein [Atopobiaceae bacterium]
MESSTKILRRLLDERGAEWMPSVFDPQHETFYSVDNGVGFIVTEFPEIQRMSLACDMRITPEQAVEATLGLGTCEVEGYDDGMDEGMDGEWFAYAPPTWYLSCGHEAYGSERPHYCPVCGRKVEP